MTQEPGILLEKAMNDIREQYRRDGSMAIFNVWYKDIRLVSFENHVFTISTGAEFKVSFMESTYGERIKNALIKHSEGELTATNFSIKYVPEELSEVRKRRIAELEKGNLFEPPAIDEEKISNPHTIVKNYTFENFIVASSNKFAHAASLAVAKSACEERSEDDPFSMMKINPLFIYGKSGLGKTHLLYAITNEIKKRKEDVKILYRTAEDFTNELIESLKNGQMPRFRERYRSVDVLLLDDIQFIAGKESVQEEFFHTFCALYEGDRQIILTSDRPPREIKVLQERLLTRFEWGLLCDIQPPSFELRLAIIKKKAEEYGLFLEDGISSFLAKELTKNIRQIEGALKRIRYISMVTGEAPTIDVCRRSISDFVSSSSSSSDTVERILRIVSKGYGISMDDIKSRRRQATIAEARHVSVYIIRQLTDLSLTQIGVLLDRDHATIMNSIRYVESAILESSDTEYKVEELIGKVREGGE